MKIISVVCLFLSLTLAFLCGYFFDTRLSSNIVNDTPDFSAYTDIKQKKTDFFLFLLPKIQKANQKILKERTSVTGLLKHSADLTPQQSSTLFNLAKKYKVETQAPAMMIKELLKRVNTIPASLVLAQAANESAWATSRFAVQGNNLFGQWCYVKDCGLIPKQRGEDQHHEVAQFKTVQQSIESYMRNLNTQFSYESLRLLRQELISEGTQVSGYLLAQGLIKYSTRREEYVKEIQSMIKHNGLSQYD